MHSCNRLLFAFAFMKKVFTIIVIFAFFWLGWHYRFSAQKYWQQLPQLSSSPVIDEIKNNIFAPPPLKGSLEEKNSFLTVSGVIKWTNNNRLENGNLPALKENLELNQAAKAKVADMFKLQYFEHESPTGRGPADLAESAGYSYIVIGENLALGNFENDEELVTAWMNSPGHRANMLNKNFMEIGMAVGRGSFEGKQVWLAVQEFGKPTSACPTVEPGIKARIDSAHAEIDNIEPQLLQLKTQIDNSDPKNKHEYDEYNQKIAQYNSLVAIYNNKVDSLKLLANQYNSEVRAFNACAGI